MTAEQQGSDESGAGLTDAERASVCPTCEVLPGNRHDPQNNMDCAWTDALVSAVERILIDRIATARREADEMRARLAAVDIAAILDTHDPGDYTHLFYDDPGTIDPPVGCRCGWRRERGVSQHDHLAGVLRAALANPSADPI
jgi:hypothetical protein